MRATVGLLVLLLSLSTSGSARADEPAPPIVTTTTLTATVVDATVTLRATVTTQDGSVPEGTVVVDRIPSETLTLAAGTVTWTGPISEDAVPWTATYVPADARWAGSVSIPTWTGNPCYSFVDSCGLPYTIRVDRPRKVEVGERARLSVEFSSRGSMEQPGRATVTLTGPRHFAWSREIRVGSGATNLRTPRLTRSGTYRITADGVLDQGLEKTTTVTLRVVRPRR